MDYARDVLFLLVASALCAVLAGVMSPLPATAGDLFWLTIIFLAVMAIGQFAVRLGRRISR